MATADMDAPEPGTPAAHGKKKGGDRLQCVVVTPEHTSLDQWVDFVALPLFDGELGVLPGRAPLIGRLGYGELRTEADNAVRRYFVDGGFAQVRDDVVTVLTNRAIPAPEIDAAEATQALEQAQARRAVGDEEQAAKVRDIARARAQLRVASHRG